MKSKRKTKKSKILLSFLLITMLIIGTAVPVFADTVYVPTARAGDPRLRNFGTNPNTLYQNAQGTTGNNYTDYRDFYLTFAEEFILTSVDLSIAINSGRNPTVRIYGSDSTFTTMDLLTSGSRNSSGTLTLTVSNNSTAYQYYIISMQSNWYNSNGYNIWSIDNTGIDNGRCYKFNGNSAVRYTITTAVDPANSGTVSGAGTYDENINVTLTATPETGYVFSSWQDGSTINPRTITVTQDETYTATFSPVIPTYTVSASANPVGSGSVTGTGTFQSGSTTTLTATANTGYQFVNWNDGSTINPRTITVNSDVTLVANFELIPEDSYLVSVSVSPNGSGYVTGGGYYEENDEITLTAVPNSGYEFVDWSDGETDNPRTFTMEDQDVTLIANFQSTNPVTPVNNETLTLIALLISFLIMATMMKGGLLD